MRSPKTTRSAAGGFTMIELMIVVAVIAILAAIAIPLYGNYIKRSKIIQATTALADGRSRYEQCFLDNRTYVGGCVTHHADHAGTAQAFVMALRRERSGITYTITATGNPAEGMEAAFVYTINEGNVKTSTGPSGWSGNASLLGDTSGRDLHVRQARDRGFSLIELMVAITIFALLVVLATPMYTSFMGNSQIRAAGESLLSGIRLAQAEAVRRNTQVAFVLDPATGWQVSGLDLDGNAQTIQTYAFKEGAAKTNVTPTPAGATTLTYDGLGRIVNPNPDATLPIDHIDITNSNISSPRDLRIAVGLVGGNASGVKLCDPAVASTEPQACP